MTTLVRWLTVALPTVLLALLMFEWDPLSHGEVFAIAAAWAGGTMYGELRTEAAR